MTPASAGRVNRIAWPDYARGIGILLVVEGHVLRGLTGAGILPDTRTLAYIDAWIYSFHMPLFFFISGLFAFRSARKPGKIYVLDKVKTILYPYFVWSVIQSVMQIGMSSFTNNPMQWRDLLAIFYDPPMQYWFLYVLFIIMLLYILLEKNRMGQRGFFLFSLAFFLTGFWHLTLGPWGVLYMVRNYILFFGLGVLISGRIHAWITRAGSGLILCLSLLFFALLTLLVACGAEKIYLVAPVAAMTGTAGVVALAVFLDRATRLAFVRQWGVVSLQIFVAHTVATAGFRIVLQKGMGVDAPLLQVLGGTVAGMYVPILLDRICNRVGFRYLFTLR